MLVAASVCPHPPLLLPEVSVTPTDWLDDLRAACAASVRALTAARPDAVVAVGGADEAGEWGSEAGGTLASFGVDTSAGGDQLALPLSVTVAARLLDDAGWRGERSYVAVAQDTTTEAAALGQRLVSSDRRIALLVMGDGSAKRTTEAPGYFDERATPFDRTVVDALVAGDSDALLAVSEVVAEELWVAGRPSWQVLAGALRTLAAPAHTILRYDAAPSGVGYFVVDFAVDDAG